MGFHDWPGINISVCQPVFCSVPDRTVLELELETGGIGFGQLVGLERPNHIEHAAERGEVDVIDFSTDTIPLDNLPCRILDSCVLVNQRDFQEAERTLDKLTELLRMEREKTWLYSAQFVPGTCGGYESWTNELRSFFHHNLLEEIYAEATVCVAPGNGLTQNLLLLACKDGMDDKKWEEGLKIYCRFIDGFLKTDCHVYAAKGMALNGLAGRPDIFAPYLQPEKAGESCLSGIIWEEEEQESAEDENDRRMEMVIDYIRTHLYKNISRSEAAQMACLSEEYFSRVFKSYTGWTFKDFVLKEKMKLAGQLLSNSVLPVGVIASKLGFDNFSHFSQVFKKISGCTPQEYRKRHKDE